MDEAPAHHKSKAPLCFEALPPPPRNLFLYLPASMASRRMHPSLGLRQFPCPSHHWVGPDAGRPSMHRGGAGITPEPQGQVT